MSDVKNFVKVRIDSPARTAIFGRIRDYLFQFGIKNAEIDLCSPGQLRIFAEIPASKWSRLEWLLKRMRYGFFWRHKLEFEELPVVEQYKDTTHVLP